MAAPNIVDVTTITGKTAGLAVTATPTAIVGNGSSSGNVLKVNTLLVANIHATNNAPITVVFYDSSTTTTFALASAVVVPVAATLDLLSKSIYLEEGDEIRLDTTNSNELQAVCSYEEIN